jgi:hypothetical protein
MVKKYYGFSVMALALVLGACKKEEKVTAAIEAATQMAAAPEPKKEIPKLTADERAAKLGFAKYLPQDTQALASYYRGSDTRKRFQSSNLWKLIQSEMGGSEDVAEPTDEEPYSPAALFDTEFTIALGKPSFGEFEKIGQLGSRYNYFNIFSMVKAFDSAAKSGADAALKKALSDSMDEELFSQVLRDPKSGMELVEKLQMPPLYVAFKVKEADREAATTQLASLSMMANMLGEMVEPASVETAGFALTGVKILGSKISEMLAKGRTDMDRAITPEMTDRLLAALGKKDLVLLTGRVDDYVVLFLGPSTDSFKLSADAASSLCGGKALGFVDGYAGKDLSALMYAEKLESNSTNSPFGSLTDYIEGIRDGMAAAESLGDTRDIQTMLRILGEREESVRKMAGSDAFGAIAYFEEGLKIESIGGSNMGSIDYQTTHKLAHLSGAPGAAFFMNVSADPVFQQKASDYTQALFEFVSALSQLAADSSLPLEGYEKAREITKIFNTQFRGDFLSLWATYRSDFLAGIGKESAWVIDLKGSLPKVPGASDALLAEAKVPRISLISPVIDRAKISDSWVKMNTAFSASLGKLSTLMGRKIPMQEPLSSEKNGATTWFFALPFFTNDFLPSVTLNDRWFIASTSKNQAVDLIAQADAGGAGRDGLYLSVDFKLLGTYASESLKLAGAHAAEFTASPLSDEKLKELSNMITLFDDVDRLTLHSRKDGEVIRTSIHLKTR